MAVASSFSDLTDRLPPQNLEAERGVLGSILLSQHAIDEVVEILLPAHFYHDAHQRMFAAICQLYEKGINAVDPVTLGEELVRRNELDEVGGPAYLHEILESVPHAAHARYYASIVRDKYVQRSLIESCTEILRNSYDVTQNSQELLEQAEQRIFHILEQQENVDKFDIRSILLDAWDRINTRMQSGGNTSGLPTGHTDLDAKTTGFQPAELIILAARPSMGKTALVCNWAESIARESGLGVLIFSLEQSRLELAERFLCIHAAMDGHSLRSGDLTEEQRDKLMQASQLLSEIPLFIDDQPGRPIMQIAAIARRMKRQHNIGLVIVDYLQLIEPEDRRAPREQQIAQITRRLKHLAKEMDVPVIALAQLNRGVELREDKRPRLADLRESGAIEQDADLVMFLHRPDAYDPEDRPGEAEVLVAKHRSGPTGIVSLTWRKECMRFDNFSPQTIPAGGYFDNGGSGDQPF